MKRVQKYSLKQNHETKAGFKDFAKVFYDFDMPVISDSFIVSQQFVEMIYKNIKAETITLVHGPNDTHSIYADKVLIAKIRGSHLVKLWMPGLTKQNRNTEFLKTPGVEYVIDAGFPDLIHGGSDFMKYAYDLKHLYVPKMKDTGINTLKYSQIERLDTPSAVSFGDNSLYDNEMLTIFNADNLQKLGKNCLYNNNALTNISWPNVTQLADNVLFDNLVIEDVFAPKLAEVGHSCPNIFYNVRNLNCAR